MELDRVAWQLGGLAEAGVRFAFERVVLAAGRLGAAALRVPARMLAGLRR